MLVDLIEKMNLSNSKKDFVRSFASDECVFYSETVSGSTLRFFMTLNGEKIEDNIDKSRFIFSYGFTKVKKEDIDSIIKKLVNIQQNKEKLDYVYRTLQTFGESPSSVIGNMILNVMELDTKLENLFFYDFGKNFAPYYQSAVAKHILKMLYNNKAEDLLLNLMDKNGIKLVWEFPDTNNEYLIGFKEGITDEILLQSIIEKDVSKSVLWYYNIYNIMSDTDSNIMYISIPEEEVENAGLKQETA